MKTVILPEDLIPYEKADVLAYDYRAQQESTKQQVDLSMNTFSFLMEGYKEVHSDIKSTAISNTEFLLMKAGKCLMTEKLTGTNNSYRSVLFFFPNEAVLQFVKKYSITLSKNIERKTIQPIPFDRYLRTFAESLTCLDHLSSSNRQRVLQVKFEELILYLIDNLGHSFLESLITSVNDYDLHFQQVIENNKLNKLTLNELAFLCNMSLSTFKRTFEKQYRVSPSKWFQERRLEYAAILLKNERKRPSDIYLEVGYESLTNFIQAFKSKYGVTPKQFQST
ncbi:AraC-like DNA-binding protein [Catalinimonas alkaloidigena]|uniref:helix-turn-helix domain-containing protein n=1 Tax=Catalinimonas alkaloidigena TaxID=1075417 RepID=UPI0024053724|nr:AraC family transcriptional regulator [Catalinimonas alkaloidigena]MDF9795051.1 AraC-like DNA-binding protein [Catalinimonas alkaloidigena]